MTDDLKERLLELCNGHPNATIPWPHRVIHDALAYITDLEARLSAAEANVNRLREGEARLSLLLNETARARDAAEAGEDALAKAGSEARIALAGMVRPYNAVNLLDAALAAYEARRKG